jgi:light-regulated signal transduction histidine kinase (bacteriophytochrome)
VGSKGQVVWHWVAVERGTKRVVGWAVGDRSAATCRRLWASLPADDRKRGIFDTDEYVVSRQVLPATRYRPLTVCDTGQGITPDILPHIFDPFFTTRDDGTGLGLSIVQQIIHDHGGAVDVQSEPGQGTQMALRLPIAAGSTERRYDEVMPQ